MFIYTTNILEIYYKKEISLTVNITITNYIKWHIICHLKSHTDTTVYNARLF